jgi:ATP-dependent Lhr-like helicase
LGGRSWKVTHVDWERRHCFVEATDGGGKAKWSGSGGGLSYNITRGVHAAILGAKPAGATFTGRAAGMLEQLRQSYGDNVSDEKLIVRLPSDSAGRWWTWAGTAASRTLQTSLPAVVDPRQRIDEKSIRLIAGVTLEEFSAAVSQVQWQEPAVDANALRRLKFSAALPADLATRTLSARLGNRSSAEGVASKHRSIHRNH